MVIGIILALAKKKQKQNVEPFTALDADGASPVAAEAAPKPQEDAPETFLPFQQHARSIYNSAVVQLIVAALICTNFLISMIKTEYWPSHEGVPDDVAQVFDVLDMTFTVLFTIELFFNMYGFWFHAFWSNTWNIFDVFIVAISWLSRYSDALPGMQILRLFRAFRVFRLFKRMAELRKIIAGILRSLPGVSNAFVLLGLMMAIWSILGTQWFKDDFPDFYGTFYKSMLTQFQIMTFDSWSSGITRPMCMELGAGWAIFFVSYLLVNGIVMSQVVVAILLDTYLDPGTTEDAKPKEVEDQDAKAPRGAAMSIGNGAIHQKFYEAMKQARIKRQIEDNRKKIKELKDLRASQAQAAAEKDGRRDLRRATNPKEGGELLQDQMDRLDLLTDRSKSMRDRAKEMKKGMTSKFQAAKEKEKKGPFQQRVNDIYDGDNCQKVLAGIIFLNFFISIVETQLLPKPGSSGEQTFKILEIVFTVIFSIELAVNMVAHWCIEFWTNGWNLFDFLVVGTSLLSLVTDNIPGIQVLRLFRAFRVFRLFKKIKELKKIMTGVLSSMPGVGNAFVLLGLVMAIWSVMGTEFFKDKYPDEYGNFFRAMLTQIQIMSFDSWCSGVTRQIVLNEGGYYGVYFITYVFATSIIMANVVVAILLDKYLSATQAAADGDSGANELSQGEARVLEIQEKVLTKMRSIEASLLLNGASKKK